MELLSILKNQFGEMIDLEPIQENIYRVFIPVFHEDGDMLSIYLDTSSSEKMKLRDFGNTLMRVSYTFDIDTQNKRTTLASIVSGLGGEIIDGELLMNTNPEILPNTILQFSQLVAKVSNIEILRNELIKSLFFENLKEFVFDQFKKYEVQTEFRPTKDKDLVVDYKLQTANKRPIYMFGVNKDPKASKVIITCLTFQKQKIPFRSLIIHENFDSISNFNRSQLTNAADKQYVSLEDFRNEGAEYIEREFASA